MFKEKIILILDKVFLISTLMLIIFAPFSDFVIRRFAVTGFCGITLINILKYKKSFYKHLIPKAVTNKPLSFFILAVLLSVFFSTDFYYSQKMFFQWFLFYLLFFFLGINIADNKKNLLCLTGATLISGLIVGIGGCYDYFMSYNNTGYLKLYSYFGSIINIGPFLAAYIPFTLSVLFFSNRLYLKIISLISILFLFFCFLFNGLEALWIAVALSTTIIFWIKDKRKALFVILLFVISFIIVFSVIGTKVQSFSDFIYSAERIKLWKISFSIFQDFPIFGTGLDTYRNLLYKYIPYEGYVRSNHHNPHNIYFKILSDMGIVGFCAFLWLLVIYFKNFIYFIKSINDKNIQAIQLGMAAVIIAVLVYGFFWSHVIRELKDVVLFWLFLGASSRIIYQIKNSNSSNTEGSGQ
ncbi:MAG: O-antigen ligase family protein [Candidatus Omnitrophica bacterium]|nr:O-antigen ligase family protein [Candidatus Omnitrophota bacterium]